MLRQRHAGVSATGAGADRGTPAAIPRLAASAARSQSGAESWGSRRDAASPCQIAMFNVAQAGLPVARITARNPLSLPYS